MSKELRLGLFTILILAAAIWGYKYLMGKNLLSNAYSFQTIIGDVSQLDVSSPVLLNGLKIGSITNIDLNKKNLKEMMVTFIVEGEYQIPKNAVAVVVNESAIGGRVVTLRYDELCKDDNCAQSGDIFKSESLGLIGSLLGSDTDVDQYIKTASSEFSEVISGLGSEDGTGALNGTIRELEVAVKNISLLSANTNRLVASSYSSLNKSLKNMEVITSNLAANNNQITGMLNNMNTITSDLKNADLSSSLSSTTKNLDASTAQLQKTLETTDGVMNNLNEVLAKANEGEGSLSKLLNDKALYQNLESTSQNLSLLLQDLRLNPKRYVNVSVFGKKNKEYVKPENDPAYDEE